MPTQRERELEDQVKRLNREVEQLKSQPGNARVRYAVKPRYEYKSQATWNGLPLVHICTGADPETGRMGVARGVLAIGDAAIGVIAIGGFALGVVCLGGLTCGLIGIGGLAVGLIAGVGGVCFGGLAFGGVAIGGLAVGGVAVGYIAIGGAATGIYAIGGEYSSAREFQRLFTDPDIPDFVKRIAWFVWELR